MTGGHIMAAGVLTYAQKEFKVTNSRPYLNFGTSVEPVTAFSFIRVGSLLR